MNIKQVDPVQILLIEDNLGDVELIKVAFKEAKIPNQINVARDGEEAINYLFRKGPYKTALKPDLILLDLNLPKKDGRELLDTIKRDPVLKVIPIIIITSSEEERDVSMSYLLHANSYIVKPVDVEKFIELVKAIEGYWLQIVKLPH